MRNTFFGTNCWINLNQLCMARPNPDNPEETLLLFPGSHTALAEPYEQFKAQIEKMVAEWYEHDVKWMEYKEKAQRETLDGMVDKIHGHHS